MNGERDDRARPDSIDRPARDTRSVRAALLAPDLTPEDAARLVASAGWRPAALLAASPTCPAARRRLLEQVLAERGLSLPDGEAIALARVAPEATLQALATRRAPRVLEAILAAPRATAAVAAVVRGRRDLSRSARAALLGPSRFAGVDADGDAGTAAS